MATKRWCLASLAIRADKRPENAEKVVVWHIAMKRSVHKAMKKIR